MNKVKKLLILFLLFLLITGCSNITDAETSDTESIDTEENPSMGSQTEPLEEAASQSADDVDYDLTTMNSDILLVNKS